MASYLDSYGVADQRREKNIKRVVIGAAAVVVVGLALFLFLRTWSEERVAHRFLDAVQANDPVKAYEIWGCGTPCRDYPFQKFLEDWGPKGVFRNGKYTIVDVCGEAVILTLEVPNAEPVGIWVNRANHSMSYAPWARCPGRHLHLWEFLKSKFA